MKFAVIGAGMMGSAIITGIVNNNVLKAEEIFISDPDTGKCEQLKARLGVNIAASNAEAVSGADAVLVGETHMRAADKKAKLQELRGIL